MSEELKFEHVFSAPRERVFAWFADPVKLGKFWGARIRPITPGTDPAHPHGTGEVREVKAGAFSWEETVTAYTPLELIEYRITKGGNVKDHFARIRFSDAPEGTRVQYEIRFDTKVPGTGRMFAATMRLGWTVGVPKTTKAMEEEAWKA